MASVWRSVMHPAATEANKTHTHPRTTVAGDLLTMVVAASNAAITIGSNLEIGPSLHHADTGDPSVLFHPQMIDLLPSRNKQVLLFESHLACPEAAVILHWLQEVGAPQQYPSQAQTAGPSASLCPGHRAND